ncbi:MAG TPA: hypothetical protein ENN63_01260 [Bacteroidetes bacterium]|nr:hypothetical protein [Bacteroidota bacterium]
MKNRKLLVWLAVAGMIGIMAVSCEKSDMTDMADIEEETLVENIFNDILATVNDAEARADELVYSPELKKSALADSCPVITIDNPEPGVWPKTITIDFGEGCEGFPDRIRTGRIIIMVTGRYRMEGSVKTVTLENYTVNGISVEGTKTIVNEGRNNAGNLVYSISLANGKVTLPDGKVAFREVSRTREWVSGEDTFNPWDDVYFITGQVTGTSFKGVSYTHTILTPLEVDAACRFIKSGTLRFEADDRMTRVLDYGYGDPWGGCDALALSTREDGETRVITLRFRHPSFLR